jgi:sec-independent protein translocase protein TatA
MSESSSYHNGRYGGGTGEYMGPIGMQEMVALFVIALLLFGPKKLPELGKTLGKALSEFRRAKSELKATLESHMNEIERETRLESSSSASSTSYSYPYDDYGQHDYSYTSSSTEQVTSPETSPATPAPAIEASPNGTAAPAASSPVPAHSPVADTVPRSHGVQPVPVPAEKEHRD